MAGAGWFQRGRMGTAWSGPERGLRKHSDPGPQMCGLAPGAMEKKPSPSAWLGSDVLTLKWFSYCRGPHTSLLILLFVCLYLYTKLSTGADFNV